MDPTPTGKYFVADPRRRLGLMINMRIRLMRLPLQRSDLFHFAR